MKSKRKIMMENSEAGQDNYKEEKAKALELLVDCDDFVLITRTGSANSGVSAVCHKAIPFMVFGCMKMGENLMASDEKVKELEKNDN